MYNVFNTKQKQIKRVRTDKFKMFRAVKHFKKCALCGKQIDSSFKDSVCLNCNDLMSIAHIEHNKKYGVVI